MPDSPTFDEQMVEKLQALLLANAGATSVNVDGVAVTFGDLQRQLAFYEKRVALANGTRPRVSRIYLGGF